MACAAGSPEIPGSGEQRLPWPQTHPHLHDLTAAERATSDLLAELFGNPALLKLGFAFHNDLHALVNSYPHLPVFAALPVRLRTPRRVPPPPPPRRKRARRAVADTAAAQVSEAPAAPQTPGSAQKEAPATGTGSRARNGDGAAPTGSVVDLNAPDGQQVAAAATAVASTGGEGPQSALATAHRLGAAQRGADTAEAGKDDAAEGACEALPGFPLCSFVNMSALEAVCRRRKQGRVQESLNTLAKRCVICPCVLACDCFDSVGSVRIGWLSEHGCFVSVGSDVSPAATCSLQPPCCQVDRFRDSIQHHYVHTDQPSRRHAC